VSARQQSRELARIGRLGQVMREAGAPGPFTIDDIAGTGHFENRLAHVIEFDVVVRST